MTTDLESRLRAYRPALDDAIELRLQAGPSYVASGAEDTGRRRPWTMGVALLTAVAAVVAMVAVFGPSRRERTRTITPAAAPAEGRVVLEAPGWRVSRVDEQADGGEMTFTAGTAQAELHWYQGGASELQGLVNDRAQKAETMGETTAAGQPAKVLKTDAGTGEYRALWAAGGAVYEFRAAAATPEEFGTLAAALRVVDQAAWEAALPPTAVRPDQRAATVDEMLTGVPLPPGFDKEQVRLSDKTKDRYQLGAEVAGAVVCGWIEEWLAAKAAADSGRIGAATAALASSHSWPVLQQMNPDGDYPEVVWQYADAVAGDGTVVGGKRITVESSYRDALGCRGTIPSHG